MRARVLRLTMWLLAAALIGRAVGVLAVGQSGSGGNIETVATFDSSAATENICQKPDGSMYVTGIDDRVVWKISPNTKVPEKFATLTSAAAVIGVAPIADSIVVTAADRPFRRPGQTPPTDFSDVGPKVVAFDKTGHVRATIPGPKGSFFNGITPAGNGTYLIADTNAGAVWQVDLEKKQLEVWLKDDRIAGANGIKIHNGWVYLSTRGGLQRIQIEKGRPKGEPEVFAKDVRPDDFDITRDGTIYFPRGTTLFKVSPTGEVTHFRENIQDGPAALVSRDGKWLYWPTRGGDGPQKVLRIQIP